MKNKMKKIAYAISAGAMFAPLVTMAADSGWARGSSAASSQSGLPGGTLTQIITNIMLWGLGLIGIIGIIGFIIAGVLYLTAAGDDKKMESAKKAMTYSIVGVVVALMGWVIIKAVASMLGGTSVSY